MNIGKILSVVFASAILTHVPLMGAHIPGQDESSEAVQTEHWKHLDDSNFEATIANGVTIVDFYAEWCPPCRKFGPVFEQVAKEMSGTLTFAKANVDSIPKNSKKYQVASIPCIILFKDGKEVKRRVGVSDAATLKEFIQSAL